MSLHSISFIFPKLYEQFSLKSKETSRPDISSSYWPQTGINYYTSLYSYVCTIIKIQKVNRWLIETGIPLQAHFLQSFSLMSTKSPFVLLNPQQKFNEVHKFVGYTLTELNKTKPKPQNQDQILWII